jgi:signal transduction histidine kinase
MGYLQSLDDVLTAARPDSVAPVLELGVVLRHVARARHDINNPLTSALAETQLLLMDVDEGELRESLETIQRQIRRIRDLVAELSVLRPPAPSPPRPPGPESSR